MAENLEEEMVASYGVVVTGVKRTKAQAKRLDDEIRSLRRTVYQEGKGKSRVTVTEARFSKKRSDVMLGGREDIFSASVEQLERRIEAGVSSAVAASMDLGRKAQAATLEAAVTKTGLKGGKRKGPGRNKTGKMIKAIAVNVEVQRTGSVTQFLGWHGWRRNREDYIKYQELGTKGRKSGQKPGSVNRKVKKRREGVAPGLGVPAANSLGASIIIVREDLKRRLKALL